MSTFFPPSQMIAPGEISFASDRAIKDFQAISQHLDYFKAHVESVKLDDGQVLYTHRMVTKADKGIINKKVRISLVEADITVNTSSRSLAFHVFIDAPIIGHILLVSAIIPLKVDDHVKLDFDGAAKSLASGYASVTIDANNDVILTWDFVALKVESKGSHIILHI
ncbi:hypothetical protein DEU56DRAFT_522202 [Suillus clintonianus]|uniref:uncharacterized protein n=1 Tax=Suillus clintonianus TaxID=1904413 RepID=UPI001B86DC47|nr:uncharacterized protein DEU56DRAFT_522202 [Suillus clintonianus]KAG2152935.1 hypothetical protein DEU56DRAFT_522202 [Suillus clintonianus]